MNGSKINSTFIAVISVFFFWGFVAASNGILIPLFKYKFALTQFKSQMVDLAFYMAYAAGSIIYYVISSRSGDPLNKIGYKKGLIYGLLISSAGALLFIPAANFNSYLLLLAALFVIGLGFALQQIVANPFVVNFGNPKYGSHRLNLAGGINSFGTTIGPVLLSLALFGSTNAPKPESMGVDSVKTPALILFCLFLLCAFLISLSKSPVVQSSEPVKNGSGVFKYPQLVFGMLAIFVYVGVEVSIQSNLAALLEMPEIKGIDHKQIAPYISLYWGSLMIGRWTGALSVFELKGIMKHSMKVIVPLVAFGIIYFINTLSGSDVSNYSTYLPFIFLAILLFILAGEDASRTLLILSLFATAMMILGLLSKGDLALYSFISGGLFCSVMWPCIFALAINGLGKYTNQGSSLLIMMILGGAIIPPLQGWIADQSNAHASYIVTVFCFAYLAWYAYSVKGFYKKQGITSDSVSTAEH